MILKGIRHFETRQGCCHWLSLRPIRKTVESEKNISDDDKK